MSQKQLIKRDISKKHENKNAPSEKIQPIFVISQQAGHQK
jgi:hypothetical protein